MGGGFVFIESDSSKVGADSREVEGDDLREGLAGVILEKESKCVE